MVLAEGIRSVEQLQRVFPDFLESRRDTKTLLSKGEADRIKKLLQRPDIPYLINTQALENLSSYLGFGNVDLMSHWELSWYDAEPKDVWRRSRRYLHNFLIITQMEIVSSGSARRLFDQFNISVFGRYPLKTLINQDSTLKDKASPIGVVVMPEADSNGAFYKTPEMLHRLSRGLNGSHRIKIAEAGSKTELAAVFEKFHREYGQVSFAILAGHGNPHSLRLGFKSEPESQFGVADLLENEHILKPEYFESGAKIILDSCYTGIHGGVAHHLAHALGVTTIGPDNLSYPPAITPKFTGDGLDFRVSYGKGVNTRIYGPQDPISFYVFLANRRRVRNK